MRLFLDANVIYSASRSISGASYAIFQLREKLFFSLVTSKLALVETEKNLFEKERSEVIDHFYELIKNIDVISVDSKTAKRKYKDIIEEKDAPILYGALKTKADYLLTLDKKHFFTKRLTQSKFPFEIMTPGEFIRILR